ncbi:MAG: EscU/YscU/HrcU family type III secretion system export apparatus switch protein [Salinarimonas sp.]
MANKDDSEEATLEATPQKLRQLREKGQIPRSQEVTGAITLLAVLAYVLFTYETILDSFALAFIENPAFDPTPFPERLSRGVTLMTQLLLWIALPVMAVAILSSLVATLLDCGGFLFSMERLAPNFAKFNPAEGLKNMFQLKSFIDLLKSIAKMVILFICLYVVVRMYINDAVWAPTCGVGCIFAVGSSVLLAIILIATFLIILFAAIDFVVSRVLFLRDNKMTQTERKREMKESFGDPHVRGERKRVQKEMADTAGLVGPRAANLWIAGPGGVMGVAYKPEQSGVPIVAAKGLADNEARMRATAAETGAAIIDDPELFAMLAEKGKIGKPIPRDSFTKAAQALVRAGFSG